MQEKEGPLKEIWSEKEYFQAEEKETKQSC